jgi:molybdopterin-containing oxidoreductase family membrane subunit
VASLRADVPVLAAFSTPLVLSVHSVVSFDFAMAITPAGTPRSSRPISWPAPFSRHRDGLHDHHPIRKYFRLQHTRHHQPPGRRAKLALFTSMVVGCAYIIEFWVAWYSANEFEQAYFWNRVFGQWWWPRGSCSPAT